MGVRVQNGKLECALLQLGDCTGPEIWVFKGAVERWVFPQNIKHSMREPAHECLSRLRAPVDTNCTVYKQGFILFLLIFTLSTLILKKSEEKGRDIENKSRDHSPHLK